MANFPSIGFGSGDVDCPEGGTEYKLDVSCGPQDTGGVKDQPQKFFGGFPPEQQGEVPNPGSGFKGYVIDFASVAPVKYESLGKDTPKPTKYVIGQPD